jgi:hypothetical protein
VFEFYVLDALAAGNDLIVPVGRHRRHDAVAKTPVLERTLSCIRRAETIDARKMTGRQRHVAPESGVA